MPALLRRLPFILLAAALALPAMAQAKPRLLSLNDVQASPISLMVAKKIDLPLIIVLDPGKIAEPWVASKKFTVTDWSTFVSRDLAKAMGTWFDTVKVQGPAEALPDGPHLVADVKIDRVQFRPIQAGGLTYNVIEMQWGFALRFAGADDYLFSFAGTAHSKETYASALVGLGQLLEDAIGGLLAAWSEKGTTEAIRAGAAAG